MQTTTDSCGVRLVRLINTRIHEIVDREVLNDSKIRLYSTGEYWNGFDRSAYLLSRIFPNLESFVVNLPGCSAVIGVSVPDKVLRKYLKGTSLSTAGEYLEIDTQSIDSADYGSWHDKKVSSFRQNQQS